MADSGTGTDDGRPRGGIFEVVLEVVMRVAPEEQPALRALAGLPQDRIGQVLAHGTRRDDPLGFGMGEVAVVVTPIVWATVQQVVNQAATSAVDGAGSRIRAWVRRRLHRDGRTTAPLPHFDPAQLDTVRSLVLEQAARAGMDHDRAELLAFRLVERLSASESGEQAQ